MDKSSNVFTNSIKLMETTICLCELEWGVLIAQIDDELETIIDLREEQSMPVSRDYLYDTHDDMLLFKYTFSSYMDVALYLLFKKKDTYTWEKEKHADYLSQLIFSFAQFDYVDILNHSTKEQTRKLEALGELTCSVVHDLNNILSIVYGYIEFLKNTENLPTEAQNHIDKLEQASALASNLTAKILSFSRKENDKYSFDIIPVIKSTLEMFRALALESITIYERYLVDNFIVYGSESGIENVLINLCKNARDAMENDGIIKIMVEETEFYDSNSLSFVEKNLYYKTFYPGKYIVIKIEDFGCGISEEIRDSIFIPFFTTKVKDSGTGLGLGNVLQTVFEFNGMLGLDSVVGRGTIFSIYFPLFVEVKTELNNLIPPLINEKPCYDDIITSNYQILVIDDEVMVNEVIVSYLKNVGYNAISFYHPLDAIKYYKTNYKSIDLVILDISMPVLNGAETAYLLKMINRHVKILALSGYDSNVINEEMKALSVNDYLQKPFKSKELLEYVSKCLANNDYTKTSFNIQSGLDMIDNNLEIYNKLLDRYFDYYGDADVKIGNYLKTNDVDGMQELVHKIRGISGNIGSDDLFKLTSIIDDELKIKYSFTNIIDEIEELIILHQDIIKKIKANREKHEKI